MPDGLDTEWPSGKRRRIASQFSSLGRIGFWTQLALLAVSILLGAYVLLMRRPGASSTTGFDLGNYFSFGGLLVMMFTTYWFLRYIRLGELLKDPGHGPPQSTVVATLWVGLWAGCAGVAFSMLLLFAAAWRMLFVLLTNPQSGMLVAPSLGTSPTYSISAIDAVTLTLLIISLGAELIVLGLTLWLLFRMTWQPPTQTQNTAALPA